MADRLPATKAQGERIFDATTDFDILILAKLHAVPPHEPGRFPGWRQRSWKQPETPQQADKDSPYIFRSCTMDELDLTGKRIALYTRSKDILEGRSALLQAAVCEDFVTQRGGVIAHRFADVKSPGADLTLSGLAALQQACSTGEIDCIVVYRSDRIMRHRAQWSYLRQILESGVKILCATENLALRRGPEIA